MQIQTTEQNKCLVFQCGCGILRDWHFPESIELELGLMTFDRSADTLTFQDVIQKHNGVVETVFSHQT